MRDLLPTTIEEWLTKKSQFVKLSEETSDPGMAKDYEGAVSFCDRHIIQLHRNPPKAHKRVKCMVIAISIAVVLAIVLLSGCQTFKGATGDLAWGLQKLSDNVQTEE